MLTRCLLRRFVRGFLVVLVLAFGMKAPSALAAMSFCNRTAGPIEAALGYRGDAADRPDNWVSEGWWRIEPGQCARVYGQSLSQRFYFYYARALAQVSKEAKPTIWAGKYMFCTSEKAFRVDGDGDCSLRKFQSTGFQELDIGSNTKDYTLDFKDGMN